MRKALPALETENLALRPFNMTQKFWALGQSHYDQFDDHIADFEHEITSALIGDIQVRQMLEIARNPNFYFARLGRSGVADHTGTPSCDLMDIGDFLWGLSKELQAPQPKGYGFAILNKNNPSQLIGHAHLFDVTENDGVWSIMTDPNEQGKGYAREATMELTRFAFEDLGLPQLTLRVKADNAPSRRNIEVHFGADYTHTATATQPGSSAPRELRYYRLDRAAFLESAYPRYLSAAQEVRKLKEIMNAVTRTTPVGMIYEAPMAEV